MALVWSFLVYTLILYVVSYILVEYGQKYLYDEVPPYVALKVGIGAVILAAVLTWTKSSFDTMFTADLLKTVVLALVWAGVFILVYRFQPVHGALFALALVMLVPGLATMVVQGATNTRPDATRAASAPKKPFRSGSGVNLGPAAKGNVK